MAKQDKVKIITTGVLVVLLLAVFIVAFINRNELVQKVQTLGKEGERPERIIESPMTPTDLAQTETKVNKDLNTLDTLPTQNWQEANSKNNTSMTGVILPKDNKPPKDTLAETKIDPSKKEMNSTSATSEKPAVSNQTEVEEALPPMDKKQMRQETAPKDTKLPETKSKSKAMQSRSKSQKRMSQTKKRKTKPMMKDSSSVDKRLKEFEYRYEKQNRSYDRRFREIEDRIEAIEKQLNP